MNVSTRGEGKGRFFCFLISLEGWKSGDKQKKKKRRGREDVFSTKKLTKREKRVVRLIRR